jgi:hypothetical protein
MPPLIHYEEIQMTTHDMLDYEMEDRPAYGLVGVVNRAGIGN